ISFWAEPAAFTREPPKTLTKPEAATSRRASRRVNVAMGSCLSGGAFIQVEKDVHPFGTLVVGASSQAPSSKNASEENLSENGVAQRERSSGQNDSAKVPLFLLGAHGHRVEPRRGRRGQPQLLLEERIEQSPHGRPGTGSRGGRHRRSGAVGLSMRGG